LPIHDPTALRVIWDSRLDPGITQVGIFHQAGCGPAMVIYLEAKHGQ
jgi:hypothetical protein